MPMPIWGHHVGRNDGVAYVYDYERIAQIFEHYYCYVLTESSSSMLLNLIQRLRETGLGS